MPRPKYKTAPSESEEKTAVVFDDLQDANGTRASLADVAAVRGVTKQLIANHVRALIKFGFVRKVKGTKRYCFELTTKGEELADTTRLKMANETKVKRRSSEKPPTT